MGHLGIKIILSVLVVFVTINIYAQKTATAELYDILKVRSDTKPDYKAPLKTSKNEFSVVISTGFLFYKTFISSQDKPSCIFTPSCSEYSVEAFKRKGPVIGLLQTFDRLSRCHGFVNPRHYPINPKNKLFYDPVD